MQLITPNLIVQISYVIAFFGGIYVWYYYNGIQGKIKKYTHAYMLELIGDSYNIKKVITIRDKKIDTFKYNSGSYILPNKYQLIGGSDNKIYYQIGVFNVIWFKNPNQIYNTQRLETILKNMKIQNLMSSKFINTYLMIIVGMIILFVALAGASFYLYNEQSKKIIEMSIKLAGIYANSSRTGGGIIIP